MDYTIQSTYPVEALFEFSVDTDGLNFLVIYGKHINGGFCCIPNWQISCEMSEPSDTFFNAEALQRAGLSGHCAKAISQAIREISQKQSD